LKKAILVIAVVVLAVGFGFTNDNGKSSASGTRITTNMADPGGGGL
jgi:hypothetical protein